MRKIALFAPVAMLGLFITGCDEPSPSNPQKAKVTQSAPNQDPKKGWVKVDSDGTGWHMDQKCIGEDLVTRSEVYGGYDITTHIYARACLHK
jgi:hypothetical protein